MRIRRKSRFGKLTFINLSCNVAADQWSKTLIGCVIETQQPQQEKKTRKIRCHLINASLLPPANNERDWNWNSWTYNECWQKTFKNKKIYIIPENQRMRKHIAGALPTTGGTVTHTDAPSPRWSTIHAVWHTHTQTHTAYTSENVYLISLSVFIFSGVHWLFGTRQTGGTINMKCWTDMEYHCSKTENGVKRL